MSRVLRSPSGLMIQWKDSRTRESCSTQVTVYYSKRIQITIGNRKRSTRRAQESSRHELPDVLSQWSHLDSAYCPGNDVWQHTQSIASQGSSPELWCLVCIGGSHVGLDHQHDGTLISSHPRGHQCWVALGLTIEKHIPIRQTFQGLRGYLPGAGQGPNIS